MCPLAFDALEHFPAPSNQVFCAFHACSHFVGVIEALSARIMRISAFLCGRIRLIGKRQKCRVSA
jgi:hypothetical protein